MDPYDILGVSRTATDEEIKEKYRELVRKYHPDNYGPDNPLIDLANEKMAQINEAYEKITEERAKGQNNGGSYAGGGSYTNSGSTGQFAEIRRLLNARRFREAEKQLTAMYDTERTAEWHYLYSVVLMRRGRANDAMRELETACMMDPGNLEYQKAKEMFNTKAGTYGSTYYGTGGQTARTTNDDICEFCIRLKMLDCLCECLGGDLIPCI